MSNRAEIKKLGAYIEERTHGAIGLTTYSPGDGMTRYRLGRTSAADGTHDYFGDYQIMTANGAAAAVMMLAAFIAGMHNA